MVIVARIRRILAGAIAGASSSMDSLSLLECRRRGGRRAWRALGGIESGVSTGWSGGERLVGMFLHGESGGKGGVLG